MLRLNRLHNIFVIEKQLIRQGMKPELKEGNILGNIFSVWKVPAFLWNEDWSINSGHKRTNTKINWKKLGQVELYTKRILLTW